MSFSLVAGAAVWVYSSNNFISTEGGTATLNVNSTGNKSIKYKGATLGGVSQTYYKDKLYGLCVYDGSAWAVQGVISSTYTGD